MKQQPSLRQTQTVKLTPMTIVSPRLNALLDERLMLAAKLSQLELHKKELDVEILGISDKKTKNIAQGIETDEYTVTPVNAENSFCDPLLLLKAGVRPQMIAKCTRKTPYRYPRITKKKILLEGEI